jgi:hypothetical protein
MSELAQPESPKNPRIAKACVNCNKKKVGDRNRFLVFMGFVMGIVDEPGWPIGGTGRYGCGMEIH